VLDLIASHPPSILIPAHGEPLYEKQLNAQLNALIKQRL